MRVYGDLFEIQGHFLSMMDFKLQYPDIYLTYVTDEKDEYSDDFIGKKSWFIDELCQWWEVMDSLESIMMWVGADTSFWEDADDDTEKEFV